MTLESATGRAKNCRNQLEAILIQARKDESPDEEDVQYALDELHATLDEISDADS